MNNAEGIGTFVRGCNNVCCVTLRIDNCWYGTFICGCTELDLTSLTYEHAVSDRKSDISLVSCIVF